MTSEQELKFFLTGESTCSYLAGKKQKSIVADPDFPLTSPLYTLLAENGFRRSGDMAYRPNCDECKACIPVRIPTAKFKPSRAQRRNIKKNEDLVVTSHPATFNEAHFKLYCHYLAERHSDSAMNNPSKEDYLSFLTSKDIDSVFYEFRFEQKLIAVAVTDILENGLSAVYTYYHPDFSARGLGTYAILWQLSHALQLKLPWLYLGFWIEECEQMAYKTNYQPIEGIQNQQWQPIHPRGH